MNTEVVKDGTVVWIGKEGLARIPQIEVAQLLSTNEGPKRGIEETRDPPRIVVGVAQLLILEPCNEHGLFHRLDHRERC